MSKEHEFPYTPGEHEAEKASNSYLMSIIAGIAGLPLPVINLIATVVFYFGNRKGTYFVRWHCTQALFSQASLLFINTAGFIWALMIFFGPRVITNSFIAYIIAMLVFNVIEFISTLDSAIKTRKGLHVEWFFYGNLTNLVCRK